MINRKKIQKNNGGNGGKTGCPKNSIYLILNVVLYKLLDHIGLFYNAQNFKKLYN